MTDILHALGVGGVTALAIWIGYVLVWCGLKLAEWWDTDERG